MGKGFGQNASEIICLFHESTIWVPINNYHEWWIKFAIVDFWDVYPGSYNRRQEFSQKLRV